MASRTARTVASAALALAALTGITATATPAGATTSGTTEGCTPGFWKNHPEQWQEGILPTHLVSQYFTLTGELSSLGNLTLAQALDGGGGSGRLGSARILLRASVAALLNAAHDPLLYPWRRDVPGEGGRPALIPTVNSALAGNRDGMLNLASRLDTDNNLGCPL